MKSKTKIATIHLGIRMLSEKPDMGGKKHATTSITIKILAMLVLFNFCNIIIPYISIAQSTPVISYTLGRYVHLTAGGIVVKFHRYTTVLISLDRRSPEDGAAEIVHQRKDRIIFHLECFRNIVALEIGTAGTFGLKFTIMMRIDIY